MNDLRLGLLSAAILAVTLGASPAAAQVAVADALADMSVAHPAYARDKGPVVGVDAGHNNHHTIEGRYGPFATVLRNDGYRVVSIGGRVDPAALKGLSVLVVANPLAASNINNWKLPTPSAFEPAEIAALRRWVSGGGSLFLIADHMPFAGAATDLAAAFGFRFENVYAVKGEGGQPEIFSRAAGNLGDNAITRGGGRGPALTEVETFVGSSFRAPPHALPIMTLDESWALLFPTQAGKSDAATPRRAATRDDLRAAALVYGKGRIVVVAEAALFTNQVVNGRHVGFGRPTAIQDKQLLLNIVEWLSRAPDGAAAGDTKDEATGVCPSAAGLEAARSTLAVDAALAKRRDLRALYLSGAPAPRAYGLVSRMAARAKAEPNPRLAELYRRMAEDQFARIDTLALRPFLGPGVHTDWEQGLDEPALAAVHARLQSELCRNDVANTTWLKADLRAHGWYRISVYGADADRAAWSMVQHAQHDLAFREEALAMLEPLWQAGETKGENYAALYDDVAAARGRPPRFGLIGDCTGPGIWTPRVSDRAATDAWRAKAGLPPLADEIAARSRSCPG